MQRGLQINQQLYRCCACGNWVDHVVNTSTMVDSVTLRSQSFCLKCAKYDARREILLSKRRYERECKNVS